MKLSTKSAMTLFLGMCIVLTIHAYFRVQNDIFVFETDMKRDHRVMQLTLAMAVREIWDVSREAGVAGFVRKIDAERKHMSI